MSPKTQLPQRVQRSVVRKTTTFFGFFDHAAGALWLESGYGVPRYYYCTESRPQHVVRSLCCAVTIPADAAAAERYLSRWIDHSLLFLLLCLNHGRPQVQDEESHQEKEAWDSSTIQMSLL